MVDFDKLIEKHKNDNNVLVEKYRPKSIGSFVGNEYAVQATKNFFLSWRSGKPFKTSLLYYGPPGLGKTTLALLLAKTTGQEVLHLNASDLSKKEDITTLVHNSKLDTFETLLRIIIVDECDRISSAGQKVLVKLLKETSQPIILICNDISKISPEVKSQTIPVVFSLLPDYVIRKRIEQIAEQEGIPLPEKVVMTILQHNKSVRGAVNSLQDYMQTGEVAEDSRDLDLTDVQKMQRMLTGTDLEVHMDLDLLNSWLAASQLTDYDVVSGIDIINKRVRETQDYSMWEQGFAMASTARGKLCDFPYMFLNIHNMKKKTDKVVEEKEDEIIRFGKPGKKKKKDDGEIKFKDDKTVQNKTDGMEDFV